MKKSDLPKDTDTVRYFIKYEKVITQIRYDCGCEWHIIWKDITKGQPLEQNVFEFCEEHDPTLPWVEEWDNEEKEWIE